MSQIYKRGNGNGGGGMTPANILTGSTDADNDDGIRSVIDGDDVTIELTNRVFAQITTTDDVLTEIAAIPLGSVPGVYVVKYGSLMAFNSTDGLGATFTFEGAARTDGSDAFIIGIEVKNNWKDIGMEDVDFQIDVEDNDLVVEVQGLNAKTLNWEMFFEYSFVGEL